MRLLRKDIGSEFVRFAVVGVTATGVHYAVYWLLQHVLNVNVAYKQRMGTAARLCHSRAGELLTGKICF